MDMKCLSSYDATDVLVKASGPGQSSALTPALRSIL